MEDRLDDVSFDELALSSGAAAHGGMCHAIDIAQRAGSSFVQYRDGVCREEVLGDAGSGKSGADVLGSIFGRQWLDGQTIGQPRVQGAVSTHGEALVEIG